MRENFQININRDVRLNGYIWRPEDIVKPRAIIQLAHGMAEHILRYDAFANYLNEQGYVVIGHDHRGHGSSIMAPDDRGFFADEDGFEKVVNDVHLMTNKIREQYSDLPIVLFGHSMGSFVSRRYIQLYGEELDGVILSGTGFDKGMLGEIGILLAKLEVKRIGRRTPSKLMDQLSFSGFNKKFNPVRTNFDFLSRDNKEVDKYITDKDCGFISTAGFYVDLLTGIKTIHQTNEIEKIPKYLPIYLISGDHDPVGDHGDGVKKVYQQYKSLGIQQVDLILYPEARHELLNEINKREVYQDLSDWLTNTLY